MPISNQSKKGFPIVAIVGRPNVGKSLLFNRLAGKAVSLVDAEPGVTRDRIYAEVNWRNHRFCLVDTGGLYPDSNEGMMKAIEKQVALALEEAAAVVWVLDQRDGVTALDEEIAEKLRLIKKTIILAVNKADNLSLMQETGDFYCLGFGEPVPLSAFHGLNTDVLLDRIVSSIPKAQVKAMVETICLAIVGRPNVGKSSFINSLLKEERVMVDSVPGTTRGVIPIPFSSGESHFILLDTSGLRKRSRIKEDLETKMSVWTNRAIRSSQVSILLIDAEAGVTQQEARISAYIWEKGKGLVIAINKWDLIKGDDKVRRQYIESVRQRIPMANFVPIIFTSALTGYNIDKCISASQSVFEHNSLRIETHLLNKVIGEAVKAKEISSLKIRYVTQVKTAPPVFVFFVNNPGLAEVSYIRYLAKIIYTNFDFSGVPLKLFFRKRH